MSLVNGAALSFLDVIIRDIANPYTYPLQLALFTSASSSGTDPASSGDIPDGTAPVTNEVTTTSSAYARQNITFGSAATIVSTTIASISNTDAIDFPTATATWADGSSSYVNGWGIYETSGSAFSIWSGAFDTGKGVLTNDTVSVAIGNLTLRLT